MGGTWGSATGVARPTAWLCPEVARGVCARPRHHPPRFPHTVGAAGDGEPGQGQRAARGGGHVDECAIVARTCHLYHLRQGDDECGL
eukprot:1135509-Prymnesium_polylepis.1